MASGSGRVWDASAVLAASNEWFWVPEGAPHVTTDEYVVVAYPEYFLTPTSARVLGSDRDATELVDEIGAVARGWGRERLWWRVSEQTRPSGLEPELLSRGARLVDRMDVLEDEEGRVVGLDVRLGRPVHVHRDAATLVPLERDVLRRRRSRAHARSRPSVRSSP